MKDLGNKERGGNLIQLRLPPLFLVAEAPKGDYIFKAYVIENRVTGRRAKTKRVATSSKPSWSHTTKSGGENHRSTCEKK